MADFSTSADGGDGSVHLGGHAGGSMTPTGAGVTAGHTWAIVVGALALLWLFGGILLRRVNI